MSHILNAFRSFMQQGGGGLLLPEMMLVLFAMGILLTDYLLEARDKYFNALMAMLGVIFSAICLWQLRPAAASGQAIGFSNSLLVDPFFLFFGFVFLIATALVIILSVRYLQIEDENHGEYYALILFAAVGMMFMASGYDLIVQFLGLETMAISFYVLAGFLRRDRRSNESAVKYLLLGAFSSGILAYGFSILYGLGATANLSPFGGPLLPRLLLTVFWPVRLDWEMLLAGVAILSLTVGNFAAITQTNIKRMLAYSSISHVGYILLGIVAAASSPQGFLTGMKGVAFYLFVYGFMTIGAFAVVIVLQRQGIISDELDDLNGLYRRSPASAVVLLIFMLSLAGIPPLAGFVGKYFILQALIETGHNRLALFGALYIVPALYYYFRIVAHAYLYEPGNAPSPILTIGQKVAFVALSAVTVAAGIYPEPFIHFATYSLFFPMGFSGH